MGGPMADDTRTTDEQNGVNFRFLFAGIHDWNEKLKLFKWTSTRSFHFKEIIPIFIISATWHVICTVHTIRCISLVSGEKAEGTGYPPDDSFGLLHRYRMAIFQKNSVASSVRKETIF